MEYDIHIDLVGAKTYYKKGTYINHREDGPAIITELGSLHWFINGKRHRTDGPAIEWADGNKLWYINGKLHRIDGPAVECPDGSKEWWIDGKKLSPEKEIILNKWWNNKNGI